jgi:CheY-like chemotaxis protein
MYEPLGGRRTLNTPDNRADVSVQSRRDTPTMALGTNILIVEDDLNVRDTIEDVLTEEGHAVSVARNGADALVTLDHLERPGLILLDMQMPVMDGLTFLSRLGSRKDREDFEVIIMSAAVAPEWFLGASRVTRALRKPFEVGEIISLAGDFSRRRSASKGARPASPPEE